MALPLAPGVLVHNRPTQVAHVFGRPAALGGGDGDTVELASLQRGVARRRGGHGHSAVNAGHPETDLLLSERLGVEVDADDVAYVQHELQPHHTLAGIALQYRVTVRRV